MDNAQLVLSLIIRAVRNTFKQKLTDSAGELQVLEAQVAESLAEQVVFFKFGIEHHILEVLGLREHNPSFFA